MRYRVVAFEKHPVAGADFTQAEAGETVGILLEPICNCPACTTEDASQTDLVDEQHDDGRVGAVRKDDDPCSSCFLTPRQCLLRGGCEEGMVKYGESSDKC